MTLLLTFNQKICTPAPPSHPSMVTSGSRKISPLDGLPLLKTEKQRKRGCGIPFLLRRWKTYNQQKTLCHTGPVNTVMWRTASWKGLGFWLWFFFETENNKMTSLNMNYLNMNSHEVLESARWHFWTNWTALGAGKMERSLTLFIVFYYQNWCGCHGHYVQYFIIKSILYNKSHISYVSFLVAT